MTGAGLLGCVLAGGQSSRFGSDKALAMLAGQTLIEQAVSAMTGWCDAVIVVGRNDAPAPTLPDWPHPGMGPLGGIAAALRHAQAKGYAGVLTCGVDSANLPADLPALLGPAPACLADQPVIGIWPVAAADAVADILAGDGRHSLRALAERIGARMVRIDALPANINTPDDLAALNGNRDNAAPGENDHGL